MESISNKAVCFWFAIILICSHVDAQEQGNTKKSNTIDGKWMIESVQDSMWTISPALESKVYLNFNGAISKFAFVDERQSTSVSFNLAERLITNASSSTESKLVLANCEIEIDSTASPATIDFHVVLPKATKEPGSSKNEKTILHGIYTFKDEKLIVLVGREKNRPKSIDDKNFKYRVNCKRSSETESTPR